jgi:hypothetical protein
MANTANEIKILIKATDMDENEIVINLYNNKNKDILFSLNYT